MELVDGAQHISATSDWYRRSAHRNHLNFTRMFRFAASDFVFDSTPDILDYGGGGGQFASVVRSHLPVALVHLLDIDDDSGLPGWEELSTRIRFDEFESDSTQFDLIFMNDVYEHVIEPVELLTQLASKLKPGGRIFIDTPRQFWLYPITKIFAPPIHDKLLRGTVTKMHLQIWSDDSLRRSIERADLEVKRWERWGEYTQEPGYYLKNMGITNPVIRLAGRLLYRLGGGLARNKLAVLLGNR